MNRKERKVDTVSLLLDRPTELTLSDLSTWVIWQFPRKKGAGLCGAVHPPIANHGWIPAIIRQKDRVILVHGHTEEEFSTPNAAADWLVQNQ